MTRNDADADDLVQETFTRCLGHFEGLGQLPTEERCGFYLRATLQNCLNDQIRRQRTRARNAAELTQLAELQASQAPAEPLLSDSLSTNDLTVAVEKLSPRLRETFELRATGLSYTEIASKLGVPLGTVSKRLNLARAKLNSVLLRLFKLEKN